MIQGPQSYQDCALPTELCQNLLGLPLPSLADFYYKFPLLNLLLYLEILKVLFKSPIPYMEQTLQLHYASLYL